MGTYTIVIEGHGQNQNGGDAKDADIIAKACANALRAAGQENVRGAFVYGVKILDATLAGITSTTPPIDL